MNKIFDSKFAKLTTALEDVKAKGSGLDIQSKGEKSFAEYVLDSVDQVNDMQSQADSMSTNLAIGNKQNIHETMLALSKAELSFNLMVQIRNKALEAYQEVMRMPV